MLEIHSGVLDAYFAGSIDTDPRGDGSLFGVSGQLALEAYLEVQDAYFGGAIGTYTRGISL